MTIFRDIQEMKANGYDEVSIQDAEEWNARWEHFLKSPIGACLDNEYLEGIAKSADDLVPDAILFAHGFLPIWWSVGGNVIAYHPETKAFYWADHDRIFCEEYVLLPETYAEMLMSPENLMKALIKISDDDCSRFLDGLREGVFDEWIDELD